MKATENTTTTTATATPAPATPATPAKPTIADLMRKCKEQAKARKEQTPATPATESPLNKARAFFANTADFVPTSRDDLQVMVNHWNALATDDRTPALREYVEKVCEDMTDREKAVESFRLAGFNGADLFRELFNAEIPTAPAGKESPKAEAKRVECAVGATTYRPRFKQDGGLEIRVGVAAIKMRDILKAKEVRIHATRADRHAEKTDPATAWGQVFTAEIESAILSAIIYAEKVNTNADKVEPLNAHARTAVESINAIFPAGERNPFALNSKTATQEQVRVLVEIITESPDLAHAWTKYTAGNLYADLYKIRNGAEVIESILNASDIFARHAHYVKYGKRVVIDGASIHTADPARKTANPAIIA